MPRTTISRTTLLVPAIVCLAIGVAVAVQLLRGMPEDFYWTPAEMAVPLDDARARVEVVLDGELLQQYARRGDLRIGEEDRQVAPEDLRVRFNNFDRVSRGQMIVLSVSLTAAIVLLVVALAVPARGKRPLEQ